MNVPHHVHPEAVSFQSEIDRLRMEPAPLLLRLWPGLAAGLIVGSFGLSAVVPIDVVVVAPGQLATAEPPLQLRAAATTRLETLLVHPGDVVQAGQVLAHLDPTQPAADLAALIAERDALRAKIARFEAQIDGGMLDASDPTVAGEALALSETRNEVRNRREALLDAVGAIESQIAAAQADAQGLAEQLQIAREVETMRETLAARQSGSQLAVLEARMSRLRAESDLNSLKTRLQQLRDQRQQAVSELEVFNASLKRSASETLAEARPRLAVVEEQISKATSMRQMSDIVAPRPGVVLRVAQGGAGSLVTAGESVAVLVPTDVPLIAEVGLRSTDVGRAVAGNDVHLKIDAFPWRRHGQLTGVLSEVAQASFVAEGAQEARHPARVTLKRGEHLTDLPEGATLLPGMTLSAEIHVGERTLLATFFEPILRGLSESFREP